MRVFTFRYRHDLDKFILSEMKNAISGKSKAVRPDELFFDNINDLMRSASGARLELFRYIVERKPSSLYALAQMIEKDQAYVLREAKALESMGLIRLISSEEGKRNKLRPEALYDQIVIELGFSKKAA